MTLTSTESSYTGASTHYLSPDRRDPVKRQWEEPFNRAILSHALDTLALGVDSDLAVLDVGAGTGDGLALLESALPDPAPRLNYLGLDLDPEMVATAEDTHRDRPGVAFQRGDVRFDLPEGHFDLYLSAGVPYSHLTDTECVQALTTIFEQVRENRGQAVVVLDVLGQYSLEWAPRWDQRRWDYAMSFFTGPDTAISASMTFHSRDSLNEAISTAGDAAGVSLTSLDFYDRSVVVGRHTSTQAFNPRLPAFRPMINQLYAGDDELPLEALQLDPPDVAAPAHITRFFEQLSDTWGARLDEASERERRVGRSPHARRELARQLCRLEHGLQRGLGVGHSLIATATVDARR